MDIERVKRQIHPSWHEHLLPEFKKPYMIELRDFLKSEVAAGRTFYPPPSLTFNALQLTPLDEVAGTLLGQDPYIRRGQAMGLSFSVPKGVTQPPSLKRVFKELHDDLGIPIPNSGDLTPWAERGVLLLNSVLTVGEGTSGSHAKKGWERFTDRILQVVSTHCEGTAFLLWGNYARKKTELIDASNHLVLEAAHPSPLAKSGFLGCRHFSKANEYREAQGLPTVDWTLPV